MHLHQINRVDQVATTDPILPTFEERAQIAITTYLADLSTLAQDNRTLSGHYRAPRQITYFPRGLPIVLNQFFPHYKKKAEMVANDRLETLALLRQVCEEQKIECLTIPKAIRHRLFTVEEKTPYATTEMKQKIGFYCDNRELFAQAAQELVRFCCSVNIKKYIGGEERQTPLMKVLAAAHNAPPFDKAPLYIEDGQGKVAIIETEHLSKIQGTPDHQQVLQAVEIALRLFPFHPEAIMREARKHSPKIDTEKEKIDRIQQESAKFYNTLYTDHKAWLQSKGINARNGDVSTIELSPERTKELFPVVQKTLEEYLSRRDYRQRTQEQNDKIAQYLTQHADEMIDIVMKITNKVLDYRGQCVIDPLPGGVDEWSMPEITDARTCFIDFAEALDDFREDENEDNVAKLADCQFFTFKNEFLKRGAMTPKLMQKTEQERNALVAESFLSELGPALLKALQGKEFLLCKECNLPTEFVIFY